MTKPKYTVRTTSPREGVLECIRPPPLLLLRSRLASARGLAQSSTSRQANRAATSIDVRFSARCGCKPGRANSQHEAEHDTRAIAIF